MTGKDPDKRLSAAEYLKLLQGKDVDKDALQTIDVEEIAVLPDYFEQCLYPLYLRLHWSGVTPDDRIGILCEVIMIITFDLNNNHFY